MRYSLSLGLFVALCLAPSGCGPAADSKQEIREARARENPWPKAVNTLRRDTDSATCRRVLAQLNNELIGSDVAEKPEAPSQEQVAAWTDLFRFEKKELGELRSASFTPLDGAYLSEIAYHRDVARTIDMPGTPDEQRAKEAFDWVIRQVELRPLEFGSDGGNISPVLPPSAVLRRGSGNAVERAYVFVSLLTQLGLDGCVIGTPELADTAAAPVYNQDRDQPPMPFVAVGVRVGSDVLLFDPLAGKAVQQNGSAVTLKQLQNDPDLLPKAELNPEQAKTFQPYLVASVSSLPSRMKLLENQLGDSIGMRLSFDPASKQKEFEAATGFQTAFWNPPNDRFAYSRCLAEFLPSDEGGFDTTPAGPQRLADLYSINLIPRNLFQLPPTLTSAELRIQLQQQILSRFQSIFIQPATPPGPREGIQRGQFSEAIHYLVQQKSLATAEADRFRSERGRKAATKEWIKKVDEVYGKLSRARLDQATNPQAVPAAEQEVAEFWSRSRGEVEYFVSTATVGPITAEATYLLALCKHEQAVRATLRYESVKRQAESKSPAANSRSSEQSLDRARDDWDDANDWWERYINSYAQFQTQSYPGREAHARQLAEQARLARSKLPR